MFVLSSIANSIGTAIRVFAVTLPNTIVNDLNHPVNGSYLSIIMGTVKARLRTVSFDLDIYR
jgi:hypothetical protein